MTFNKRDPIYLQVIDHLERSIVSGKLKPGTEMPSRRQLAGQLKINPNTVQRAYSEMEEKRLIYTEPNRTSRVTEDAAVLSQLKEKRLSKAVGRFVSDIAPIDISIEELTNLIKKEMKRKKEKK